MSEEQPGDEVRELTADEVAELEKLDDAIAKFEQQKRWSDMIRSILKKAELIQLPTEKAELFRRAGTLYLERSSNQAEAIKCFEELLEYEAHDVEAIQRLKEMYEKRRDWEKLIRTMQREVELLPEEDQLIAYAEMADLATQRLRKPGDGIVEIAMRHATPNLVLAPEHQRVGAVAPAQQILGVVQARIRKPPRSRHPVAVNQRTPALLQCAHIGEFPE